MGELNRKGGVGEGPSASHTLDQFRGDNELVSDWWMSRVLVQSGPWRGVSPVLISRLCSFIYFFLEVSTTRACMLLLLRCDWCSQHLGSQVHQSTNAFSTPVALFPFHHTRCNKVTRGFGLSLMDGVIISWHHQFKRTNKTVPARRRKLEFNLDFLFH